LFLIRGWTMRCLLSKFFLFFKEKKVSAALCALQSNISLLSRKVTETEKRLLDREKSFDRLSKSLAADIERNRQALEDARKTNKVLEAALGTARDHIKSLEDILIPGLVAANDVFVKRWESESQVYVMRNTAAKVASVKEDE
jgi:hypothetical protein